MANTTKVITAADLFCGAGGTSQGFINACKRRNAKPKLLAINHWGRAIATHQLNHPGVDHMCETLDSINPRSAIQSGRLDLLCASPECTHHSLAAGGKPKNEQSRATAWHVCRWAEAITIDNILIENVKEFVDWGPLSAAGKPLKSKKGDIFRAFIRSLEAMGYRVEYRVLCSADFGDPTSRERLFIMAKRHGRSITWPDRTHAKDSSQLNLDGSTLPQWRSAKEIIDWQIKGNSIFRRKKPLCQNTIKRIAAGLRKFGGKNAEPFLVMLYGTGKTRSTDRPMPTVTATGNHIGLCEPFIIHTNHAGGDRCHDTSKPLPTITGAHRGEMAFIEPFISSFHGGHDGRNDGDNRNHKVGEPLPTQDTSNRYALVEPFIIQTDQVGGNGACVRSKDDPLYTVVSKQNMALIEPMILGQQSCSAARSTDEPIPTVAGAGAIALVEPFVVKFYRTGGASDLNQPLDTVTSRDRFMLVEPKTGRAVAELDILFRMLQPHELAAAQGFPKDYKFTGTREEQVKQIGNAVTVNLATALCESLI